MELNTAHHDRREHHDSCAAQHRLRHDRDERAQLGTRPQRIRKMPPVASAKRLTTLVMLTRPTFWLKEVLGSTPNSAAKLEPIPSQMTPPDSSVSVARGPCRP